MNREEAPVPAEPVTQAEADLMTPWELFCSLPRIVGRVEPELTAVLQDIAGVFDLAGVLDPLGRRDQRALIGVLGWVLIGCDEPETELRRRADLTLTTKGRGPVADQQAFSVALRR